MESATAPPEQTAGAGQRLLARVFRLFGSVEPHESAIAALMAVNVFLLLSAYYLLKTAREPLILLQGGAEVKSYAAAGQSLLLLLVVRLYSEVARRVGRMTLVASIYLFFAANLVLFAILARSPVSIGVAFYLWVGIFNVTAIAQFWSFANDIYTPEQGKRLFGILGIGSSVGAVVGARVAKTLAALGPATLMLVAAGVLVLCVGLFFLVERRVGETPGARAREAEQPIAETGGLNELLLHKYMLLMGALMLLLNCVNSNGEYLLDRTLLATLEAQGADQAAATTFIGEFKADYFSWVNLLGVLMQLFVVSRIMQYLGVRRALFVMPIVSAISYTSLLIMPVLNVVRVGKIAENTLDYSLQNTARQALFLVTSRAEKYVGKTVIDTLIVRIGDVMSAGLVWGVTQLQVPVRVLAALNLVLIGAWLVVLLAIGREHRRRSLLQDGGQEAAA